MFKVYRMIRVQIVLDRDPIRIARPKRYSGIVSRKTEGIRVLPETVDVGIVWQASFDAEILGLVDEGMRCCCEQYLGCFGTVYGKGERR